MTVIAWPTVSYVMRRMPTVDDPRGMGDIGAGNDPAQYVDVPATVTRILNPDRLVLIVPTFTGNMVVTADRFAPGAPKWGTFKPFGPTLLQESFTLDPPSVAAGAQAPLGTWTVPGAAPGDRVHAAVDVDLQGMQLTAYISATNTAKTVLRNGTAAAINLPPCTLFIDVWRKP